MHFCSDKCRSENKQCDLCLAQYRKILNQAAFDNQKPTLTYNPFATLLKK